MKITDPGNKREEKGSGEPLVRVPLTPRPATGEEEEWMPRSRKEKEGSDPSPKSKKEGNGKKKGTLPRSAKIGIILLGIFASLLIGMMIGYGILGKSPVIEVFSIETWTHLFTLIFG